MILLPQVRSASPHLRLAGTLRDNHANQNHADMAQVDSLSI